MVTILNIGDPLYAWAKPKPSHDEIGSKKQMNNVEVAKL
jgi:hypothetical protein